jgi:Protein of unknown function (DUF2817)
LTEQSDGQIFRISFEYQLKVASYLMTISVEFIATIAIAIVAILVWFLTSSTWDFERTGPCVYEMNPPISTGFGGGSVIHPCDCFSETYIEARTKFRRAAQALGVRVTSKTVFKNYTLDIVHIPGDTSDLIVHTSGVHGVEGYAGSAIQIALLQVWKNTTKKQKKQWKRNKQQNEGRPSLLLFHAVNPYGMEKYRRFNENNVDLNRNGIHDFSRVRSPPDDRYANYITLDSVFNPTQPFRFGFLIEMIPLLIRYGFDTLKQAMVTGQYHKPTGIFYGGSQLEASNRILYQYCQAFLRSFPVTGKTTWINVHTGLGASGVDTLLLANQNRKNTHNSSESSPSLPLDEISRIFKGSLIPKSTGGDDVQKGYDLVEGTTEKLVRPLFSMESSSQDVFFTQEFGTIPSILVGRAMILENFHHHFDDPGLVLPHSKAASERLRDAFYPRTRKWRVSILQRGLRVVQQAAER